MRPAPRVMFAAPHSGSGKTLVVCGVLQALVNRGLDVASFKCGPDYIDPMFHGRIIGTKSRNLDYFLAGSEGIAEVFSKNAPEYGISVVEGVMGFYDGLGGDDLDASSFNLSQRLDIPVVLVVDTMGASTTVAAVVKGLKEFRDNNIRGVILNRMSEKIYGEIKDVIEKEIGIEVLGRLPRVPELVIESRHLGLLMPSEISDIKGKMSRLADVVEEHIGIDRILEIAVEAPDVENVCSQRKSGEKTKIAVAMDEAFCFIYPDNIDLLESLGAEIAYFSPLEDSCLPEGAKGLIIPGGYPDLHMEKLSGNKAMLADIREKLSDGMPCLAEDGGFMYLTEAMGDSGEFPMVGFLPGGCHGTKSLVRFGYLTLRPSREIPFLAKGETLRCHEFHYWDCESNGDACVATKARRGEEYPAIVVKGNTFAGFPHIYYKSNPDFAARFVEACRKRD